MTTTRTMVVSHESDLGTWTIVHRDPPPALRPYVLRIAGYREDSRRFSQHLQTPITGIPLIINLSSPFQINGPNDRDRKVESFVAGLHDGPTLVGSDGPQHSLQVDLTPLGARRIFGLPMHELTNRTVDLDDLLGNQASLIIEGLHDTPGWKERFDILEAILIARINRSTGVSPGVVVAWDALERSSGKASIRGLADELGWSHRHLIAQFRDHIGLPPKKLARIMRFERAVRSMYCRDSVCLASIAQMAGYFDQAHLHRDFREFAGRTPAEIVGRRLPGLEGLVGD